MAETRASVGHRRLVVAVIMLAALRYGASAQRQPGGGSDESLLLAVFGLVLLVAGVAQQFEVSGAIGAFLVGLALSGKTEERAMQLISPLRDLFAATFFLFFSFQIDPADLVDVAGWALLLAAGHDGDQGGHRLVCGATASGWRSEVGCVPEPC